ARRFRPTRSTVAATSSPAIRMRPTRSSSSPRTGSAASASIGTRTAASRPSPTSSLARSSTATTQAGPASSAAAIPRRSPPGRAAGRGVLPAELAHERRPVHTLQLWLNLPAAKKRVPPRYQDVHGTDAPVARAPGIEARVFAGTVGDVRGPVDTHWPATVVDV